MEVFPDNVPSRANSSSPTSPSPGFYTPHAKFSAQEDAKLTSLVAALGTDGWSHIAAEMGTKNVRQCRERWFNYLSPELNTAPWTREEERLIIQKYQEVGPRWVIIANCFPHRTDSMVKNRFKRLQRLRRRAQDLFGVDCLSLAPAVLMKDAPSVALAETQAIGVCQPTVTDPQSGERNIARESPEPWGNLEDLDIF
jgi:hypothetical protein